MMRIIICLLIWHVAGFGWAAFAFVMMMLFDD